MVFRRKITIFVFFLKSDNFIRARERERKKGQTWSAKKVDLLRARDRGCAQIFRRKKNIVVLFFHSPSKETKQTHID